MTSHTQTARATDCALRLPENDEIVVPAHWSFGQLASLVGAPSAYLRQLPAPLAAINLQYGLTSHRAEQVKTLETDDGRTELRAVTGPDYGRIYDHSLVEAVQKIAGDGVRDTRWKVPGVLDWSSGVYNPRANVSKETTTLYASDRDVFLFLVDDLNPIEGAPPRRISRLFLPRLLLLELRGRREDAGARLLLSSRPSARTATSGASKTFRKSSSATTNAPRRASRRRPRPRLSASPTPRHSLSSTASSPHAPRLLLAPTTSARISCVSVLYAGALKAMR
jgi:hypothetical protein